MIDEEGTEDLLLSPLFVGHPARPLVRLDDALMNLRELVCAQGSPEVVNDTDDLRRADGHLHVTAPGTPVLALDRRGRGMLLQRRGRHDLRVACCMGDEVDGLRGG